MCAYISIMFARAKIATMKQHKNIHVLRVISMCDERNRTTKMWRKNARNKSNELVSESTITRKKTKRGGPGVGEESEEMDKGSKTERKEDAAAN